MPSVLTYATLDIGTALLEVSILGFLGIGIPPNTPELGVMVGSISYGLYSYPWQALFPAFVTMLLVVGFSFLGEGAREASDVKVRPYILFKGRAFRKGSDEITQSRNRSQAELISASAGLTALIVKEASRKMVGTQTKHWWRITAFFEDVWTNPTVHASGR